MEPITLPQISVREFARLWKVAYYNWHGKFSAYPKNSPNPSKDEKMFFIWNGPHCRYNDTELIPRVTLVYGDQHRPAFISPRRLMEEYEPTNKNPLNGRIEPETSAYRIALEEMKAEIATHADSEEE